MSYRRSYRERIAVRYSGSVNYSYPASQNGGSGSVPYSGVEYEDVNVYIDVDTEPFDNSIEHCNNNVKLLTGAVVATESAQLVSIDRNAKKVGKTIIDGFFKTIRSEISQQIVELSQKIDAHLLHLHELAKNCVSKKKQMENDYNRLTSRYQKIFEDLNNELSNRIHELDRTVFTLKKDSDAHANRTSKNDLVSTVAVGGSEGSILQAKIYASVAKKSALDTINQSRVFLWKQKKTENTIAHCMLNETFSSKKYIPICYLETVCEKDQINRSVFQPEYITPDISKIVIEKMRNQNNIDRDHEKNDQIHRYFNSEVNKAYATDNPHNNRVKERIVQLYM
ncbi:MAG: hypothetical protein EOL98_10060 [Negativicutes bacterium]|nr:hypothetical protein [Paludibacter sp.]NCD09753.1 hypothetical protein [Negativicutes bacterium]